MLKNKLGINNSIELAELEEKITKKKAIQLFETGILNTFEVGTFNGLAQIHKYLFEDIYEFAGKIRTENISKSNFRFAAALYLEEALKKIDKMPQSNFDEIIEKYIEMNIAHPFREGNGRSTRIWLDTILKKEINKVIDWSKIDKEDYLLAMERSPIKNIEIKFLLQNALTDKINDREVYMKGIDASYNYEGYNLYSIENLDINNNNKKFMNYEPIFLEPIFKDYIWGGQKLKNIFKKNVENEECTAESWEISTNKNGESIIKKGKYSGKTLTEIFNNKELKTDIFGTKCVNLEEFPLLIKFIDANKSLSVQVHPDNEYAIKNENSQGKTEMWYILDCEPDAQIICGVKDGISKEVLKEKINSNKIEECLNYINVKKGDAIYIPSGTIHALLGKTLVAEVQQNSNITYRVYDWKRIGKDGKPRELHIEKALDVINTERTPQIRNIENDITKVNVVKSEFFTTNKINVKDEFQENISGESFIAFNVIEGSGNLKIANSNYEIKKGDSFIIPACMKQYELQGKMELLQSYI